jgi:hypothetical protein
MFFAPLREIFLACYVLIFSLPRTYTHCDKRNDARGRSWKGLAEEQPDAYKDVDVVVDVMEKAGIAKKVARHGRSA